MSEIKQLRQSAGLTQSEAADRLDMNENTFGSYERGERTPTYKQMDKIREVLGDAAGRPQVAQNEHLRTVEVHSASAGRGDSPNETVEMILDERFLEGTGISVDSHKWVRLVGSGLEPLLSHNQIVTVDPCERVLGDDIYVYNCEGAGSYVVAILANVRGGLQVETKGPSPESTLLEHLGDGRYRDPDGRESTIEILGRVVGATLNPSRVLSKRNEAAKQGELSSPVA